MLSDLYMYIGVLFFAALLGGSFTLFTRWSHDLLHSFISFGAGIFLGVVFLHLLPETMEHGEGMYTGLIILAGFLFIFFVERFLFSRGDRSYEYRHHVVSITVLIGLSVHSLIEGFGLAVGVLQEDISSVIFLAILVHKVPAAFSLASLLSLSNFSRMKSFGLIALFSIMTPLGALAAAPWFQSGDEATLGALTALVTGSFLYVSTADLLPEVFHSHKNRWLNLALLVLGIVLILFLGSEFNFEHIHG
jgi:zinc transporter ZupT